MSTASEVTGRTAEAPLNPLQRRAELIAHYERHGYPERVAYLRRIDDGPAVLAATIKLCGGEPLHQLAGLLLAVQWWAGDESATALHERICSQLRAARSSPTCADSRQLKSARADVAELVEESLVAGLAARANTRLQPWPVSLGGVSPDMAVYQLLDRLRRSYGAIGPLPMWPLPPPRRAFEIPLEASEVHAVVCEICTAVDLRRRPAIFCRLCAKRHIPADGLLMAKTSPREAWLIRGYRFVHLRSCVTCGAAFFANADALTCTPRCRTARSRSSSHAE